MTETCEHWLVQRRIDDQYWACVDCEREFRPVESVAPVAPANLREPRRM